MTTITKQIFRPAAVASHQRPVAIAADYTAGIILSGIILTICQICQQFAEIYLFADDAQLYKHVTGEDRDVVLEASASARGGLEAVF